MKAGRERARRRGRSVVRERHGAPAWPQTEFAIPTRVREWAAIEVGAGRLLPWFAVAFGAGIVLYFTVEREPAVWAASGLAIVAIVAAALLRRRPIGFVVALGFLGIAAGFATATLKIALIDHPILRYPGIMAQTRLRHNTALSGLQRFTRGFCRVARGKPEDRSFYFARRSHRRCADL